MTVTNPPAFDLLSEPWLPVASLTGAARTVSLRDAFADGTALREIRGDVPTQTFALYRLLLAITMHATAGRFSKSNRGAAYEEWGRLRADPEQVAADVLAYLDSRADRFDLLHPTRPFYQVAGLSTAKGEPGELAKVIADVPNNEKYFTTRAGAALCRMSLAEAARWVVHTQAFDPSGIKSGALGDARVKNSKGYPIGPGWCATIGGVLVVGETLLDTLLLNLVPLGRLNGEPATARDAPVWERAYPLDAAVRDGGLEPFPHGPLDLLTWQSRRIRLHVTGDEVTGVLVANGDPLVGAGGLLYEPMTAQHPTAASRAAKATIVRTPTKHLPNRLFWRGLVGLLPRLAVDDQRIAPLTLEWLDELRGADELNATVLRIRGIGIQLDTNGSIVEEIVDDGLDVPAGLLGATGARRAGLVKRVIDATDQAVRMLGDLARSLGSVHRADGAGQRDHAMSQAYFAIDPAFRDWLVRLAPDADAERMESEWTETVRNIVQRAAADLMEQQVAFAWEPRPVLGGRREETGTAFDCEARFHYRLSQVLGRPASIDPARVGAAGTPAEETP